ncbi:MAG: BatA domain-containing protein, partial [Chloroflexota bacterium]
MSGRLLGTEITFEAPWAFALLTLVVLWLALEARRERAHRAGMLFSSLGLLPASRGSWRVRLRWLLLPVRVIGVTVLITALAAPSV